MANISYTWDTPTHPAQDDNAPLGGFKTFNIDEGEFFQMTFIATNTDSEPIVIGSGPSGTIRNLVDIPDWMTITDNGDGTGNISGTPKYFDSIGSNAFIFFYISDNTGGIAQVFYQINITTISSPPSFTSTPVTSVESNEFYTYNITTTDSDPSETLVIDVLTKPSWLFLIDNGDGTAILSGTPSDLDIGVSAVTIKVTDSFSTEIFQKFSIFINDAQGYYPNTLAIQSELASPFMGFLLESNPSLKLTGSNNKEIKRAWGAEIVPYTENQLFENVDVVALPANTSMIGRDSDPENKILAKINLFQDAVLQHEFPILKSDIKVLENEGSLFDFMTIGKEEYGTYPIAWNYFPSKNINRWEVEQTAPSTGSSFRGVFVGKSEVFRNAEVTLGFLGNTEISNAIGDHQSILTTEVNESDNLNIKTITIKFTKLKAPDALSLMEGVELHALRGPVFINCYSGESSLREKEHTMLAKIRKWSPLVKGRGNFYSLTIEFVEEM